MRIETNPAKALLSVGKENTELHEELRRVYAETDHFRNALALISGMPYEPAANMAKAALGLRPSTEHRDG